MHDVVVLELRRRPGLALEEGREIRVARELREKDLDRHPPRRDACPILVDSRHPATADLAGSSYGPNCLPIARALVAWIGERRRPEGAFEPDSIDLNRVNERPPGARNRLIRLLIRGHI